MRILPLLLPLLLAGCATPQGRPVPWGAEIPDYTPPPAPELGPPNGEHCQHATPAREGAPSPCTGIVVPPNEYRLLLDVATQAEPLRGFILTVGKGREQDRATADKAHRAATAEAAVLRRRLPEAFLLGSSAGAGVVATVVAVVAVAQRQGQGAASSGVRVELPWPGEPTPRTRPRP